MKIESVRSFLLSYPFPEPIRLPFYGGERTIVKRDAMFIRIQADNGLVGYAPAPGSEPVRPAIGPEQDLETVRLMRKAVGPDFDLMVDAHTWWRMGDRNYTPDTIEQLARDMAGHRIAWLEEPLPPDDHAAYLRLKAKDIVPL